MLTHLAVIFALAVQSVKCAPAQTFLDAPSAVTSGISAWAFNPSGDLAVIRKSDKSSHHSLQLLAINAQYTIPTSTIGVAHPDTLYTFIANDTFVAFAPSDTVAKEWVLTSSKTHYSTVRDAAPPRVSRVLELDKLEVEGKPRNLLYADVLGMLIVVEDEHVGVASGRVRFWDVGRDAVEVTRGYAPTGLGNLLIEEMVTNGSHLVFTAYDSTIRAPGETTSKVFTYDLLTSRLTTISCGLGGGASSPIISSRGDLAWLEQAERDDPYAKRYLWLSDTTSTHRVNLDFEHDPSRALFWQDGKAIALLAAHDDTQSLFQLWTPADQTHKVQAERIPSTESIHSAIHVGVTPLNHSHYVGVQSPSGSGIYGDEVWVISSNPWDRPTEGFENIRLTNFTLTA